MRDFCPRWRTREDLERAKVTRFRGPLRGAGLFVSAGDTGCATILTARDHGEDDRQSRRC